MLAGTYASVTRALRAAKAGAAWLRTRPASLQHHAPIARRRHEDRPKVDVRRKLWVRARACRQLLPVILVPRARACARAAALVTVSAGVGAEARAMARADASPRRALSGAYSNGRHASGRFLLYRG